MNEIFSPRTSANEQSLTPKKGRMSRARRREQLIDVARELFGAHGYDAVSIEEIASHAGVSKPLIYEHFGGKEGLYQVIVDREVTSLTATLAAQLNSGQHPRSMLENVVIALLEYIESHQDGFRLLSHQSPTAVSGENFTTVMDDVAEEMSELLTPILQERGFSNDIAPIYGQLLAGALGRLGSWWMEEGGEEKEKIAAHATNLLWYGLRALEMNPRLSNPLT